MEDKIARLRTTPLLSALPEEHIRRVAELVQQRSYRQGSTVYRQGQLDTSFYVVVSGRLSAWIRDERGKRRTLNYLQSGDSFGEHSLLSGDRRDVNIEVEEPAVVLYLEKRDFDTLLAQHPELRKALGLHKLVRLRKVPLFGKLSSEDIQRIAAVMGRTHYRRGSTIFRQGELSTTFYVIESGRVALLAREMTGEERTVTHLRDGSFFGEDSLLTGEPRGTTVQALEDTTLFYLSKKDLEVLLREYPSIGRVLRMEAKRRKTMLTRRFPWQREGEVLIQLSRKHIFAFIRSLWVLIFPLLALVGTLLLASTFDWADFLVYLVCTLIGAGTLALVVWLFVNWRNDYYAVTNKRVVHVEKVILLQESREEAPLERIQDISILMPGVVAKLLGFNDLGIQTAGATGRIVFKTIGNAAWVRDKIFEQLDLIRADEETEERETIRHKLEVELGRVEGDLPPTAQQEELPPTARTDLSTVAEGTEPFLVDLLRRCRSYLVPEMRVENHGVVTWRKHWFRLVDRIAAPLLLLFILLQLGLAAALDLLPPPARFVNYFWAVFLLGVVVGLFLLWYRYEDWRNDIYQLTDDRIIDLKRLPLGLHEERREASLAMIQDIGYEIPGIFANLLDYGNVVIETAGREAVFTFDWVHRPRRVQDEVFARMDAHRERERDQRRERRTHELLDWFATYTELAGEEEEEEGKQQEEAE